MSWHDLISKTKAMLTQFEKMTRNGAERDARWDLISEEKR